MTNEEMIEYIKHHLPIVIKYEDGSWVNADIEFQNGTIIITPNYNNPFDD